ncbi:Rne/Rng family ribonuclease, partial [Rhodococcus sp. IEGM 1379]|uniref:Rne/Rng family ribonuclease n=1 Tax=Rhodococcus sp. IEGM 1379 TaxID=3047086 RepID=UPI0024B7EA40
TESEFLARREAVDRVMVVRDRADSGQPHATTQVAVLEDGVLVEHFVTNSAAASMVGNVYLGRVQNVLPSMEAAFIDIGRGRNGVLYAGEVNWEAAGLGGNSRKIEQALKPGDQVLVQVSKDPVGHKGARLTTQISLAGRFLVYVPGGSSTGISRKLPDTERKRLKEILRDIVPADAGVIIRTASEGVSEEELARDVTRLQSQWAGIEEQAAAADAGKSGQPQALYEEPDMLVKVIRDLFNEDFSKLVIEGEKAHTTVENYINSVAPDLLPRLEKYTPNNNIDVFAARRIDEQLAKALDRKVWLPSGGTLVIDRTEAMTVVDVNTGKFTGAGGNLEETVTRNNLEAAEEIVRQMRLRDIGGMIVVDFIDMV